MPTTTTHALQPSESRRRTGEKYLLFLLGGERYGLNVREVREIVGLYPITPVPHMPPFVKGVINLRGKLIPILDLRLRFGLPEQEYASRTCTIVVEAHGRRGPRLVGLIVDSVSEVLEIGDHVIEQPPSLTRSAGRAHIHGMAKLDGSVCMLLSAEPLVSGVRLDRALEDSSLAIDADELEDDA